MNDVKSQAPPQGKRSFKSIALATFLVAILGFLGWWYLFGGGRELAQGLSTEQPEPEAASVPVRAQPEQPHPVIEERLTALETLTISLDAARREQQALIEVLQEQDFVRSEDLQVATSRLRAEIRALRASFPEAAELERSQVTLAWHLLRLAETEYRLFGNAMAVASLLERVGFLLSDNPLAFDLIVDLAKLKQDIEASQASGVLEVSRELSAMSELAARIPLAKSQYDPTVESASGFLDRMGARLRSMVRIEKLESADQEDEVGRLGLMLGIERMQVALFRRDGAALEREREHLTAWLERHAQMEHQDSQELLARLEALASIDLIVRAVDFAPLIARLGELVD